MGSVLRRGADIPAAGRREYERHVLRRRARVVVVHYTCAAYGSPDRAWFQQDLAPYNTSKVAKACKQALGLKVLPSVARSADVNPIENAWVELERRLRARPTAPKTNDQLFAVLQEEWAAIPDAYFKKLAESMPRRVRAVMAAKGAGIADLQKKAVAEWLQSFNSVRGPMERLGIITVPYRVSPCSSAHWKRTSGSQEI